MLYELHVKNLALIDEEEIEFGKGLNILSGETGAGKSIILGALDLALGGKVDKNMLRDGETDALVEAVFSSPPQMEEETDEIILSRKITPARASARMNGEMVPAPALKKAGDMLIDIYGQHEHQSLMSKKKHLAMLDEFAKEALHGKKVALAKAYQDFNAIREKLKDADTDGTDRDKELVFLEHEVGEIESANLKPGEDEELEREYRRMKNAQKIMGDVGEAYELLAADGGAGETVGRALKALISAAEYDESLTSLTDALGDADSILSDASGELSDYISDAAFDGEGFAQLEERLNVVNSLKDKYGPTLEKVRETMEEKQKRIEELRDYDGYLRRLESDLARAEDLLRTMCTEVSAIRQKYAQKLCERVRTSLLELNFLDVQFSMSFKHTPDYTSQGFDDAEFMISTNPGAPLRPLKDVASGGELSRIMLSLKTVLAMGDSIDTLIFDEIDAGISGRTAQAVAEKLAEVAKSHQVICITHLPQIAAYADRHFLIEKHVEKDSTISSIHPLGEEEQIRELARMLGGSETTEAALENARDLKKRAEKQ